MIPIVFGAAGRLDGRAAAPSRHPDTTHNRTFGCPEARSFGSVCWDCLMSCSLAWCTFLVSSVLGVLIDNASLTAGVRTSFSRWPAVVATREGARVRGAPQAIGRTPRKIISYGVVTVSLRQPMENVLARSPDLLREWLHRHGRSKLMARSVERAETWGAERLSLELCRSSDCDDDARSHKRDRRNNAKEEVRERPQRGGG